MAQKAFLGLDIGTSGCKAVLVGPEAQVIGAALAEYPLAVPKPGWAEQEPAHWWEAVVATSTKLMAAHPDVSVAAIGLSGQMHGLVALDEHDEVIRPAILWNDQRTGPQCERVLASVGGADGLLALTNNLMVPGYTGGKILWLREHEPASFARLSVVLNPKDYIRLKLTGARATDVSDASGTGLFDVKARRWSAELIAKLELDMAALPEAHESDAVVGVLTAAAAAELGLKEGVKVVAGGGDAVIQSTGSGVVAPGRLQTIIGTAGILACALDSCAPNIAGRLQVFCNNAAGLWHCMGVSVNAGGALAWLRQVLARTAGVEPHELAYATMMQKAAASGPGANGLLFLPYLQGERCPYADPDARGAFVGLNLRHDDGDLVRAVVEGVVYSLADMQRLFAALGLEASTLVASGGGAASPLWRQIQADVFKAEVITVSGAAEGGAFGGALVAGVGVGHWRDLGEACSLLQVTSRCEPGLEHADRYEDMLAGYLELYAALKPSFARLAKLG